MKRATKRSPKQAYILQVVFGIFLIVLVVGIGWGVWHVTRLPSLTIDTVVVSGGDTIPARVIETQVRSELEGSYVALIPRTFTYMFPAAAIEAAVSSVPRVKDIEITRADKKTLAVSFTEYAPFALWCTKDRDHCLFIDEQGFAFSDAPDLTGGAFVRFVVEDKPMLLGSSVLSEKTLATALSFSEALKQEFGFVVEEILYEQNGDVTYRLVGGAKLLLDKNATVENTINNLESVLDSDDFAHLRSDNFQYIDLRFGNKVFVNEEVAVPEMDTATTSTTGEDQLEAE